VLPGAVVTLDGTTAP